MFRAKQEFWYSVIYSGNKLKILTAPSEATLEAWVKALDESVVQFTAASLLEGKREAAQKLQQLAAAQLLYEVDLYRTLEENVRARTMPARTQSPYRRTPVVGKSTFLGRELALPCHLLALSALHEAAKLHRGDVVRVVLIEAAPEGLEAVIG